MHFTINEELQNNSFLRWKIQNIHVVVSICYPLTPHSPSFLPFVKHPCFLLKTQLFPRWLIRHWVGRSSAFLYFSDPVSHRHVSNRGHREMVTSLVGPLFPGLAPSRMWVKRVAAIVWPHKVSQPENGVVTEGHRIERWRETRS